MTEIIERTKAEIAQAPITELVSLKDTTFTLPEGATRDLVQGHVIELSETDVSQWPPAKVVETDEGLVIIDGYHRQAALQRQITIKFLGLEDKSVNTQNKALQAPISEAEQNALNELLDNALLKVELGVYSSENAVIKAALTANLMHGLPPASTARVHIAVALYKLTRGDTPEPSQAEIARQVGISRAALNEYLKKDEKAAQKALEETPAQEGQEDAVSPEQETEKAIEKARKATEKFIKSLASFYEECPQAYSEAVKLLLPEVVDGISSTYAESNDKAYSTYLAGILSLRDDFTTGNIPHIARLGKTLSSAAKYLEKNNGMLPAVESPAPVEKVTTV